MRQPNRLRRYALARPGPGPATPRTAEGVRRLRLVRMEAIAEREREAGAGADQPGSSAPSRS